MSQNASAPSLSRLIHRQAEKYGAREALIYKEFGGGEWLSASWRDFAGIVGKVSHALLNLGLKSQDRIGIFSQNSAEYFYSYFGSWGIRAVAVPCYATSSEQQLQFIINDSRMRLLFVGEQEQYDKARRVVPLCHSLERIVIYDKRVSLSQHDPQAIFFDDFLKLGEGEPRQAEVETILSKASEEQLACILYTSGTTGDSKGVILSHGQFEAALEVNARLLAVGERDRVADFLPLAHVFELGWAVLSLAKGATLIVNTDPQAVVETMRETHPTSMSAVPRFWEKVYMAVMNKIERAGNIQKSLFMGALSVGKRHNIDYLSRGRRPPATLRLEYEIVNRTIFSMVRGELGLEHPNIFPTAGATVAPYVEEFVHSIGLNMIVGYGLTESMATVSCDRMGERWTVGSVGRPIDIVDLRISDEGEILLKGPTITKGYYNRADLTREAFTEDGFFRTGDAGYLKDGELYLTERIKDLMKTSNGKYIAPQMIEARLIVDKFIDQIAIIADRRQFVSALIVPDFRTLEDYAQRKGIRWAEREDLCSNEQVRDMIMDRIDTLQQQLAHYEQVKRITLLSRHFSMEGGELTNTLKLRRSVITNKYRKEIEQMYQEH